MTRDARTAETGHGTGAGDRCATVSATALELSPFVHRRDGLYSEHQITFHWVVLTAQVAVQ